jgi:hypothetical protein
VVVVGGYDQLGSVSGVEFGAEVADVGFGGAWGDVEGLGDFLVGEALAYES